MSECQFQESASTLDREANKHASGLAEQMTHFDYLKLEIGSMEETALSSHEGILSCGSLSFMFFESFFFCYSLGKLKGL